MHTHTLTKIPNTHKRINAPVSLIRMHCRLAAQDVNKDIARWLCSPDWTAPYRFLGSQVLVHTLVPFFFFGENDLGTPNKAAWATGEFLKQRKPHKMEKAPPDGTKARAWGQQAARCPGCEVPSLPGRVWVLSGHPSHSPPRPRPSFPHAPTHMRGPSRVHGCK